MLDFNHLFGLLPVQGIVWKILMLALIPFVFGFAEASDTGGDGDKDDDGDKDGDKDDKQEDQDKDDKTDWKKKHEDSERARKKAEKKLNDKQAAEKKAEEEKLKKDGEYKTLSEQQEEKIKELEGGKLKTERNHAVDIAVLPGLNSRDYLKLIDYDQVEIDEEGNFKQEDVDELAKKFKESHPELYSEKKDGGNDDDTKPGSKQSEGKSFGEQLADDRNKQLEATQKSSFWPGK